VEGCIIELSHTLQVFHLEAVRVLLPSKQWWKDMLHQCNSAKEELARCTCRWSKTVWFGLLKKPSQWPEKSNIEKGLYTPRRTSFRSRFWSIMGADRHVFLPLKKLPREIFSPKATNLMVVQISKTLSKKATKLLWQIDKEERAKKALR